MKNRRYPGASVLPLVLLTSLSLTLTACGTINEFMGREDSVDYKSAQRGSPLSIPPDLTQAASEPRYSAPTGAGAAMTYSQYQQQTDAQQTQAPGSNVLPQRDDMRIERDGNVRWLVIEQAPEAVFPKVVDFWTEQGFALRVNNPRAGLIETDWAENRAKIPESGLRSLLGRIFDNVWDSGERERFRVRVERVTAQRSEVYISHDHMVEKRFGSNDAQVRWEPGPEDPGLNAAMLARLLVYLGTDADRARTMVTQAQASDAVPPRAQAARVGSDAILQINLPFERAWRQVGLALDAVGFAVEDRDRSTGDFFVRYLDTDTGEQRVQPNFFNRLFGSTNRTQAAQYRLHLDSQGERTTVTVFDAEGARDTSATAQRLLSVLAGRLPSV